MVFLRSLYKSIGIFVKELIKANTMNPVFILDEIDKLTKTR